MVCFRISRTISIYQFTHIIEKIADARAENGAEQQRIQQSYELQSTNLVNLEAAHGRIMDVDVALESTRFAKAQCTGPGKCVDDSTSQPVDSGRPYPSAVIRAKQLGKVV